MIDEHRDWPQYSNWPNVLGEYATMEKLCTEGLSLSRFGDGEMGCTDGKGYNGQEMVPGLKEEMQSILRNENSKCLVAIPTMDSTGPRFGYWPPYANRFRKFVNKRHIYGSAFIGCRAKSPWIDTDKYVDLMRALWKNKRHVVVAPEDIAKNNTDPKIPDAVATVICPKINAYNVIDQLENDCLKLEPEVVLITGGPMATCLANRLSKQGIQGIDLGRAVGLLRIHKPL